jgi:hypothetical protein
MIKRHSLIALAYCLCLTTAFSDTLVLRSSGLTVEGTIIQTNDNEILLLSDFGTGRFAVTAVKEIRREVKAPVETRKGGRLPDFRSTVLALSHQSWASNLMQIPATVIDKGVFKNVPYLSFRCGDDYEVNIYGDLNDPAAIEAGVYRKLLSNGDAKQNCLKFIVGLLDRTADKEIVQTLNPEKDIKERSGVSFEITPPYDEDAYLGWWVSVYSKDKLDHSRASEKEMANISVTKTNDVKLEDDSAWSADEMKLARTQPETITVNAFGQTFSNAVVVRVVDGAYLIWQSGMSGGTVKLSELPENVRSRFGYDGTKASATYAANEQKQKDEAQARSLATQSAQANAQAQAATAALQTDYSSYGSSQSSYTPSRTSSSGGSVYVRGYTRKDGTYVAPYTRSAPHRR